MMDWVKPGGTSLNVEHIRERYGSSEVTVHDCGSAPVKGSVTVQACPPGSMICFHHHRHLHRLTASRLLFSTSHRRDNHSFIPLPFAIGPSRASLPRTMTWRVM